MKTLISTLALTAAVALPAVAIAATPLAPQIPQAVTATSASTSAPLVSQSPKAPSASVAMQTKSVTIPTGYGQQAADDRQGLSRIQEQGRQLGATQ